MNIASNEDILKVVLNLDELSTLQMAVTMEAIWHLRNQAFTSLVVVARNEFSEVLKVWTKIHDLCSPTQAEAVAIQWALILAKDENWSNIIVEGDSKICPDALSNAEDPSDWSISSITQDTVVLSTFFDNCKFYWVRRSMNSAAHSAAKYVAALKASFLCNKYDLPPPILKACRQDWITFCSSS